MSAEDASRDTIRGRTPVLGGRLKPGACALRHLPGSSGCGRCALKFMDYEGEEIVAAVPRPGHRVN